MNIKIIGGGIAGLASAIAVANAGGKATVFEKAASFEPVGAGLQLGPNAARALQTLGAWHAIKPFTYAPPEIHMRDGRSGKILKRLTLGKTFEQRFGLPYLTAHRADLHQALLEVARSKPNISIKTKVEVENLFSDGFDGIIAADGVWSKTREKLFPNSTAITTKDVYFRSLVPMPSNTLDINFECVNLWLYPHGHVVHYPVGSAAQLNLVAITNGKEPKEFFKNASDILQRVVAPPIEFSRWQSAYVAPLEQWHKANTTLIGDAAHATLPYLAQGAAMALEDAACLQKELRAHCNLLEAYKSFEQNRKERVHRLHIETLRAGRLYHFGRAARLGRNFVMRMSNTDQFLSRLDWIYCSNK